MNVLKFGGTSVATSESILKVVDIVARARHEGPVAVVVSALGGVTNGLLRIADVASTRDVSWHEDLADIEARHAQTVDELPIDSASRAQLLQVVAERFRELHELLRGVFLLRECSARTQDAIVAYGERLASHIVAAALATGGVEAEACDARRLIVTDASFGQAKVDLTESYRRIKAKIESTSAVQVITGFTGSTPEGHTTTLGRGGSDYTAALVGAAVDARAVELWTDVSGVMTADPRVVADAFPQHEMSYAELMELSHFGAKVVHPPSIHPARSSKIPLLIKNTFAPDDPGTRVTETSAPSKGPIRGITSIRQVALLRLEGDGPP